MKLYLEDTLDNLFSSKARELKNRIESESEDYILNVGEQQYIDYLKSEFTIGIPEIHTDKVYVDTYEKDIPGSRFPREFDIMNPSKTFKKDVIIYHIPYTGPIELLRFRPSSWTTMAGYEIQIDRSSNTIVLEYINFYNDPKIIKKSYEDSVRYILASYPTLKSDIEKFNNSLEHFIRTTITQRRQRISKKSEFINALGVPLKQKSDTPKTFAVPQPKLREKIQVRPIVHTKGFKPEPTLDNDNYLKILKIINDIGKNFERLPSTYSDKYEEDLRDHILMTLDPNFEYGSASGETFNKKGKTDIQLRHDSSVVFVSECKFWKGEKEFLGTIDQLLGYLTWRDSKTSVVIFVRNKGFTDVLDKAKESIKSHPNFVTEKPANDENWFNYIFSLPDDENKEIQMAVQLFHLP
tara:strand:+ start:65 stop:1291 length:1227 start_codon:yes stop_codon:yes gene_type:complete